jgi:hypothetical protein
MSGNPHRYEPKGFVNRTKGVLAGFALLQIGKGFEQVAKLGDLAGRLAQDNPNDEECIRLLVEESGSDREALGNAAAEILDRGGAESRTLDRAYRLLISASSGDPVASLAPETDELFGRIEALYAMTVDQAYPTLVGLQPKLGDLESQFTPRSIDEVSKDAVWDELLAALDPVIGPQADLDVTDPLVRTERAHNIARLFLALRIGLLQEIEYD